MNDAVARMRLLPLREEGRPPGFEAARLGQRIAQRLRAEGGDEAGSPWSRVLGFFDRQWARVQTMAPTQDEQAFDRLAQSLALDDDERTLLLLAGMADAHEGYAAAFAALHPRGESRPTWGLFCWLVASDAGRQAPLLLLQRSGLLRWGWLQLVGDAPMPERSLRLVEGLWSALEGVPAWPAGLAPLPAASGGAEDDEWLQQPRQAQALTLLRGSRPALCLLRGLQRPVLRARAMQIAALCGGRVFDWSAEHEPAHLAALLAQCRVLGALPVLLLGAPLSAAHLALIEAHAAPLLLAGATAAPLAGCARTLCTLDATPMSSAAMARLWARVLPELAPHGALLTARYSVGPETLQQLRQDLAPWLDLGQLPPLAHCVAALKARTSQGDDSFARRVLPSACWADLVLPPERLAALHGAVDRMRLQQRVLDDWGFGRRQRHARGLRLLFSGLPGTGKTLAAEVVAQALQADLLVVDLARLVSKWIGETEKNLAAAFDQAEGSGAVLFFDEADALFGKRTEVSDAHDRYANIESAYLLARLERFDGVAILATNLRGNLDKAFLRRFELAIEFAEPAAPQRAALWRAQFPAGAPLAADVDIDQLAALHALPGALIRNAALGAAYLAAAEGDVIGSAHIERALQQEYEKSGRVSPH